MLYFSAVDFGRLSWKAFIYYLYTGKVAFACLRSQGRAPTPSTVVRKENLSPSPPLCSPKSMYKLADEVSIPVITPHMARLKQFQLGISDLKELARDDILSKLSNENIVIELFSTFTSL